MPSEENFNKLKQSMTVKKEKAKKVKSENANINKNKNTNKEINDDGKVILEKKQKKQDRFKRQTYYLTDELIKKIDKFNKKSGYNKSELVRIALEDFFKRVKIK